MGLPPDVLAAPVGLIWIGLVELQIAVAVILTWLYEAGSLRRRR